MNASDLPRSFSITTNAGNCPLCRAAFAVGESAFYMTWRKSADMYDPSTQVAPSTARTRPSGCTCRGRRAHTRRCALYRACNCRSVTRRGRSFQRHTRNCHNTVRYATLPGYWDHLVHVACARDYGFTVPENAKVTRGRRARGHFGDAPPTVGGEYTPQRPERPVETAQAETCQRVGWFGRTNGLRCCLPVGHAGSCQFSVEGNGGAGIEEAVAALGGQDTQSATAVPPEPSRPVAQSTGKDNEPALTESEERLSRLALVALDVFDNEEAPPAEPLPEPETDPSVERFRLLQLD